MWHLVRTIYPAKLASLSNPTQSLSPQDSGVGQESQEDWRSLSLSEPAAPALAQARNKSNMRSAVAPRARLLLPAPCVLLSLHHVVPSPNQLKSRQSESERGRASGSSKQACLVLRSRVSLARPGWLAVAGGGSAATSLLDQSGVLLLPAGLPAAAAAATARRLFQFLPIQCCSARSLLPSSLPVAAPSRPSPVPRPGPRSPPSVRLPVQAAGTTVDVVEAAAAHH